MTTCIHHATLNNSAASSGAGLPSALLTPRSGSGARVDTLLDDPLLDEPLFGAGLGLEKGGANALTVGEREQQQRCDPRRPPPRRASSKGVRWADGAGGGGGGGDGGGDGGGQEGAPAPSPATKQQQQPCPLPRAPDPSASSPSPPPPGAVAVAGAADAPPPPPVAPGVGAAAAARRPRLPESGCARLDRYLLYLLGGEGGHRHLHYSGWGLGDDGCAAVGAFLRLDRRVRSAALAGNRVGDDGAAGRGVQCFALRPLACLLAAGQADGNLSGATNTLRPLFSPPPHSKGAELIAEGLASNRALATLDLSDNKIGDAGALALAAALGGGGGCALAALNLQNNCIGAHLGDAFL